MTKIIALWQFNQTSFNKRCLVAKIRFLKLSLVMRKLSHIIWDSPEHRTSHSCKPGKCFTAWYMYVFVCVHMCMSVPAHRFHIKPEEIRRTCQNLFLNHVESGAQTLGFWGLAVRPLNLEPFNPVWTGLNWLRPVKFGLVLFEPVKISLVWSELVGTSLNRNGPVWTGLDQSRLVWSGLNRSGPVEAGLNQSKHVWTSQECSGTVCTSLDQSCLFE